MREFDVPLQPGDSIPNHPQESWDIGAISQVLETTPEATRDIAHGPGIRYSLGEQDALTLELFPPHAERSKGIVRMSTQDALQEFYRQPPPATREEGLIFETANLLISLSPAGELMTYRLVPDGALETPQDAPTGDDGVDDPPGDETGGSDDSVAPQRVIQRGVSEGKDGQPRVAYGGRLGTDPRTKTTPKGTFIMEFPVAVRVEGQDKPEWRNTVVFDERARTLEAEGALSKGISVDVVAYEHARRHKSQDGTTR